MSGAVAAVAFGTMMFGHALADYPLQGDFLARAKNRAAPIPGIPWYQALGAHSVIHGGCVFLALAGFNPLAAIGCGIAETVAHAVIDDAKCMGRLSSSPTRAFNIDQALHTACKALWALIAVVTA